ncbi:MAG: siderophore-interacting protein, partial [Flavobacterium sp.]
MPNAPKWVLDVVEKIFIPKLPLMKVTETELLSPSVKRIRFNGDFKSLNFQPSSYMDIRVSDTEVRRYSAAFSDTKNGIMDFIVHLHGTHPGSEYMRQLNVGDKISPSILKTHKCYNESAKKYVVFGDETSLALACSVFSVFKKNKDQFQFYFELDEENKNVPELLKLENCTVFPKDGSFRNEKWIQDLPVFQTEEWKNANFILTGNAKSVQTFRKVLKNNTSAKIISHGYW